MRSMCALAARAAVDEVTYETVSFFDGLGGAYASAASAGLPSTLEIKYKIDRRPDEANGEQGSVTFAVRNTASAGWTGVGFNSNPGMYGADFVIFEPGATTGTFRDMYNHKKPYETPLDDDHYTITPVRAFKSSSSVEFEFSRPLVACGVSDLDNTTPWRRRARKLLATIRGGETEITDGANYMSDSQDVSINAKEGIYLLYAWGTSGTLAYHASNARGAAFVHLVDTPTVNTFSQTTYVDVKPKVATTMPAGDTYYACTKHDLGTTARYVTAWEFINDNAAHLHHAQIYACTDGTDAQNDVFLTGNANSVASKDHGYSVNGAASTGDATIAASDVSSCGDMNLKCAEVLVSWAVGGNRVVLPDGTARKFGGSGANDIRYVLLERHWNAGAKAMTDASGFRMFTQSTPPSNGEIGMFLVGLPVTSTIQIGANGVYNRVGNCPGGCTNRLLSQDMNVFAYYPHQHTTGRASYVRHIRNGVELAPISSTPFYDFDFQVFNWVNNFTRVIKPGDDLVVECVYDTRGRSSTTPMGEGTLQEMCFMFLMYYPKMDLFSCFDLQMFSKTSCSPPGGLNSRTGVDTTISRLVTNTITLDTPYANSAIPTCAASVNVTSPTTPLNPNPNPNPNRPNRRRYTLKSHPKRLRMPNASRRRPTPTQLHSTGVDAAHALALRYASHRSST